MKFASIALFLFMSLNAAAQTDNYKIYGTAAKNNVSVHEVVNALKDADVLFFGEEHDDSIGHVLELQVFQKCHELYGQSLVLSLEMFETDVQSVLNEYLAGLIQEKHLSKDARVWKNYSDYKPLIEYAKTNKIKVVAANAPGRYANLVSRKGLIALEQLDKNMKKYLPPLPIDTATGKYYEKFVEIMGGHDAMMPGLHMFQAQNLWDATMAWSIAKALKENKGAKVLHLNGKFHSDDKLGIAAQLPNYRKNVKVANISAFADNTPGTPDWNKYADLADFIIITKPAEKK